MDNSRLFGEALQHPVLVLLLVLGVFLVARILYTSLAPVQGLFSRRCFRADLGKSVTHSRLGKMLSSRDVDLQYYLFSQPVSDIEKQLHNCKCCNSTDQCDCYLSSKIMGSNIDLSFCQNNNSILKVRNRQENLYISRMKDL